MAETLIMQPTLWLEADDSGPDVYGGIIQPEDAWLHTDGYTNVLLTLHRYYVDDGNTQLIIEGTDDPAGGWTLIRSFTTGGSTATVVMLSQVRPRSKTASRLWRIVRWRWTNQSGGGGLQGGRVCFKIKAVMKS